MKKNLVVFLIMLVIVMLGASGTYYYYSKYQEAQAKLSNPQLIAQEDIKVLTDKLSKLMELPSDETPQVGLITDADLEKVKDQAFFHRAIAGDKVLIFNKAMKAILFRESVNKIIEVAPVTISSPEPSLKPNPTPVTEESINDSMTVTP